MGQFYHLTHTQRICQRAFFYVFTEICILFGKIDNLLKAKPTSIIIEADDPSQL